MLLPLVTACKFQRLLACTLHSPGAGMTQDKLSQVPKEAIISSLRSAIKRLKGSAGRAEDRVAPVLCITLSPRSRPNRQPTAVVVAVAESIREGSAWQRQGGQRAHHLRQLAAARQVRLASWQLSISPKPYPQTSNSELTHEALFLQPNHGLQSVEPQLAECPGPASRFTSGKTDRVQQWKHDTDVN